MDVSDDYSAVHVSHTVIGDFGDMQILFLSLVLLFLYWDLCLGDRKITNFQLR